MKGRLIVIEGTDGSGKKTQLDLLVKKLKYNNISFETFDFPRYDSKYGKIIASYLNGELGELDKVDPYKIGEIYANDRLEMRDDILKWLNEGKFVLCNRYVESNKAHQGAKFKTEQEKNKFIEWDDNLEHNQNKMPRSDLTIFLYLPSEKAQLLIETKEKRKYTEKKKDIHEKDVEYMKRAEKIYIELAEKEGWTKIDCVKNNKVLSIQNIHEMVWKEIKNLI